MKKLLFISSCVIFLAVSCTKNKPLEFPNYKYTTVYFPYQSPVRTLDLGSDIVDNSLDNQHIFTVEATLGGVYSNTKDVSIGIVVDTTLGNNLTFGETGKKAVVLPGSYYTFPKATSITIPSGSVMGGIQVQLTDAFFADPRSITNTFVLPLRMNSVKGADSILSGKSDASNPDPRIAGNWGIVPKNYVLYAVRYINPWHGNYLRRGKEAIKDNTGDTAIIYHTQYVETDQVVSTGTKSMMLDSLLLNGKTRANVNLPFQLLLTFDNGGNCTIGGPAGGGYSVTGSGAFVKGGDSWGGQNRDVLRMKYTVDFGTSVHTFTDTLVMRDRGIKFETFTPVVVN